ncbi:MAG: chromate transporter [Eubacteriales bacterium]|nr:chromate transporter [Eubacteriales bacterium]
MRELLDLFLTFARIGGLTFGGGYAMLPMLQREVVEHRGWATEEELVDWFAVGQCTPGIIAVNVATFTGKKCRGTAGALAATLGVIFPSMVIITVIAAVLQSFMQIEAVSHAFAGIRVCVCVLIANAVQKLWKGAVKDHWGCLIFALTLAGTMLLDLSPAVFVLAAGAAGLLIRELEARKK